MKKFCFWSGDKAFRPVKNFYELRNFTNTKRKNCPTCSFFNLINRQMCIKINRKATFLSSTVGRKSQNIIVTHPSTPPIFCRHSLKLLSPTLPKLMNWILLSPPKIWNVHHVVPFFPKFCTLILRFSYIFSNMANGNVNFPLWLILTPRHTFKGRNLDDFPANYYPSLEFFFKIDILL